MIDIDLLRLFCAPLGDPREYLYEPFTMGDHTFATSGHLLIRVPKMKGVKRASKAVPHATIGEIMHRAGDEREYVELPKSVAVGKSKFDPYYIWLLNKLPDCKISPADDPNDMAYLKFDGGSGVIMPLRV